jgi:Mn-dependent DtxR family transcriptional regulator
MDFNQIERTLLTVLADEWDHSEPPGYVETTIIADRLNISVKDAKSAIRSLFVKGLVDTDKVDTFAAYLTPDGYEQARND